MPDNDTNQDRLSQYFEQKQCNHFYDRNMVPFCGKGNRQDDDDDDEEEDDDDDDEHLETTRKNDRLLEFPKGYLVGIAAL